MVKKLVLLLAIVGIILSILAFLIQNIIVIGIAVVAFLIAIYYGEHTRAENQYIKTEITTIRGKVDNMDSSLEEIKSELTGKALVLLDKLQQGNINLAETEKLKTDLERKQKAIEDRDKVITAGVVIGGLALLAYFLSKKK